MCNILQDKLYDNVLTYLKFINKLKSKVQNNSIPYCVLWNNLYVPQDASEHFLHKT